jgi:YgiT-type zinc finger domain-containing protein
MCANGCIPRRQPEAVENEKTRCETSSISKPLNLGRTNLPFKLSNKTIVVIEDLPVVQCSNCSEYFLKDEVMSKVDDILAKINENVELEVIPFAA